MWQFQSLNPDELALEIMFLTSVLCCLSKWVMDDASPMIRSCCASLCSEAARCTHIFMMWVIFFLHWEIINIPNNLPFWTTIQWFLIYSQDVCTSPHFSSVQFSHSVVSESLWPHESQHARPPCPSPSPGIHSDSCPSSPWCHPAISSSVIPFSSLPPIPPSIRFFSNESTLHMRWPKYWSFSFSIINGLEWRVQK